MIQPIEQELLTILKGCYKRNRSSQNSLYRLYYAYGMSICIRYAQNEEEAISILNDGFLKVFRNIKKYDTSRPFKPWFRRIVVNTAINHIVKNQKLNREVGMEKAEKLPSTEDILSRISYQELMQMVQSLSVAYRTVFNMYVIDGYKHHEIAARLGITESTSKSNLTRARARLKELVEVKFNSSYAR
ncbi:MAG: RNA polymerase sigma factor [Bacteroidetes bacterium]|nr:RNA polymerase sigma factor [Bacteroidota bacterium]MCB0841918.1 RNA polymerase sigma factor [Bacteroidota bacterium]